MNATRARSLAALLALTLLSACPDDETTTNDDTANADAVGDVSDSDATAGTYDYAVPLDPESPWPKFRRDARQTGRSPVAPTYDGSQPWVFQTGKGIFSTPVIDGDGNIYVGSADRHFYALAPDGTERWSFETGEIIDSSALLDDAGAVIFGSGDGTVYALDRATGDERWTFAADAPDENGAFINWFEGNVAMATDGTLMIPNDNFCTYGVDRTSGDRRWCHLTADQTWSLPALNPVTGRAFIGNNFYFGENIRAFDPATGDVVWTAGAKSTVAASPLVADEAADGLLVVGSFDGFVYGVAQDSGDIRWATSVRDHVYASPAQAADGTIIQPACDGTVYALDPGDGSVQWAFDTREPIRSSPAIDATGNIYVGSGEGRLFVLNPDGTLRWSIRLIDEDRDDLNASPALGERGVVIAGESGGIFFVPFDWCLQDAAASDARCVTGGGEGLPDDHVDLFPTTRFGRLLTEAPASVLPNEPLTLSLFVREDGDTSLAVIDSGTVTVTTDPASTPIVDVSGDRRFVTVIPDGGWPTDGDAEVTIQVTGDYLVDLTREGAKLTGGTKGGSFDESFTFSVTAGDDVATFPLPIPAQPGDPQGIWEILRIAAPLPTILPSYNQIGFDSIHYIVGLVEGDAASGRAIAWGVDGLPAGPNGATVVNPASAVRFPLEVVFEEGRVTLVNEEGFTIAFNGFALPFDYFRLAGRVDASGDALESPALNAKTVCADINFYGPFLQALGYCNPDTDLLNAVGGAELRVHAASATSPADPGTVSFAVTDEAITATLDGDVVAADHNLGLLVVDAGTGRPVRLDYVDGTSVETDDDGHATSVAVEAERATLPGEIRAYLMVDTYPAAVTTLAPSAR